ncbi:MAG: UvrB/UvrC motif-containing protein [Gemmatimonadales bacterium]|nr:UvrB/UvrC motif-containing protein [Gemmatimonadales bacterium]
MKRCSHCGEGEGVVDLTHIEGGEVKTHHLCAKCAAEKGVQTPAALADTPLGGILAAIGADPVLRPEPAADPEPPCPHCGATLQDFRETGRLGCADCYRAFGEPLRELLRRLHGSAHHTGRAYQGPGEPASPPVESTAALQARLERAIANEQFELAAQLRDRLKDRA